MKHAFAACVAMLLAVPTSAFGQWCAIGPTCCPLPCITYQWQPVICYKTEWREEKAPCVVQKVSYRQEIVPVKTCVMVPQEYVQPVKYAYCVPVPREVVREVAVCQWVPVVSFDPCSCCCFVSWCPQMTTAQVRSIVCDYRVEERVENVRLCRWVAQETVVNQVRCVPVVTQEQVWTVRRYCVAVPYQTYVCVPCLAQVSCCPIP